MPCCANLVQFLRFSNLEIGEKGLLLKSLAKLDWRFLREQVEPHLDKGVGRLKQIKVLLENSENPESLKGSH